MMRVTMDQAQIEEEAVIAVVAKVQCRDLWWVQRPQHFTGG
jgi:hypothetical protein